MIYIFFHWLHFLISLFFRVWYLLFDCIVPQNTLNVKKNTIFKKMQIKGLYSHISVHIKKMPLLLSSYWQTEYILQRIILECLYNISMQKNSIKWLCSYEFCIWSLTRPITCYFDNSKIKRKCCCKNNSETYFLSCAII